MRVSTAGQVDLALAMLRRWKNDNLPVCLSYVMVKGEGEAKVVCVWGDSGVNRKITSFGEDGFGVYE